MLIDYIPILLIMAIAAIIAVVFIRLSTLFGPRKPNREKLSPYESGMEPVGTAREKFSVKFYMVAVSFIVFDIEIVFLYPWAVSFLNLNGEKMLYAFIVAMIFIVLLAVGLIYEYKKDVLKWD